MYKQITNSNYEINEYGEVRRIGKTKHLKHQINSANKGYHKVSFSRNDKRGYHRVHRLVAEAFIPNPLGLPQVDHIDGDKNNNSVTNLQWVDNRENTVKHVKQNPNLYIETAPKAITIDGVSFGSINQGAYYILKNNPTKKVNTIRRELRLLVQGKRQPWIMYGKHTVGY